MSQTRNSAIVSSCCCARLDAGERIDLTLNARCTVSFVGLGIYKVGRTADWAFAHLCRQRGKMGIPAGNHRYRDQDRNKSGYRTYCRAYAPDFTLLEPVSTLESSAVAR